MYYKWLELSFEKNHFFTFFNILSTKTSFRKEMSPCDYDSSYPYHLRIIYFFFKYQLFFLRILLFLYFSTFSTISACIFNIIFDNSSNFIESQDNFFGGMVRILKKSFKNRQIDVEEKKFLENFFCIYPPFKITF